jgi:hypothetical protein
MFIKDIPFRLGTVAWDYRLIEECHQQAEAWMNENPGIEVVQIQTFNSSVNSITVVWYRE